MKAAVYDTYVTGKGGGLLHFDIVVPDTTPVDDVINYGKTWLQEEGQPSSNFSTKECRFCHIEEATKEMVSAFEDSGYYIIKMEGFQ